MTFTVTPKLTGCSDGSFQTTTVIVEPVPAATISTTTPVICNGNNVSVVINSPTTSNNNADLSYEVVVTSTNDGALGGTASVDLNLVKGDLPHTINGTLTNSSNAPITVTYTVTPKLAGCNNGTAQFVNVIVNPTPQVAINNTVALVCNGGNVNIVLSTPTTANNNANLSYEVVVTSTNDGALGGTASVDLNLTYAQMPRTINGTLTNSSDAPITVTYTVTPRLTGCTDGPFKTTTVVVEPTPKASRTVNTASVCSGEDISIDVTSVSTTFNALYFDYTVTSTNIPATSGTAYTGGTNVSFPFEITGTLINSSTAPLTVTYTITPKAGSCTGSQITAQVVVNPRPVVNPAAQTICSGYAPSLTISANIAGTTFDWEVVGITGTVTGTTVGNTGSGNTLTEVLYNYGSADGTVTYRITPTAPAGVGSCTGNTEDIIITVKPEPVINAGQNPPVCSGNPLTYYIALANFANPGGGVTFSWPEPTRSAGVTGGSERPVASADPLTGTFTNTTGGLGTVTYVVTPYYNGCQGAAVNVVVQVGSEPVLDPGLDAFACSGQPIGLVLKQALGSVIPDEYMITGVTISPSLSAGSNAVVPELHAPAGYLANDTYTNLTTTNQTVKYKVRPVLLPDCVGDEVEVTITIRPQPIILPGQTGEVCSGVPANMEIKLFTPNLPAGTTFSWSEPTMSNGTPQGTAGVDVEADPPGTFHITDVFTNYTGAPIYATYYVTPKSSFDCTGETVAVVITINPAPLPNPIDGPDKLCVNVPFQVYSAELRSGTTYNWMVPASVGTKTFDALTNAIILTSAASAGTGQIKMVETNSYTCAGDTNRYDVEVFAAVAQQPITGNNMVCALEMATYSVPFNDGSTYQWSVPAGAAIMGDPSAHEITLIFGNNGGTISVRETIAAGCVTDHLPFTVTVNPLPVATISNSGTICIEDTHPVNVSFTGTAPWSFKYAINGVEDRTSVV